MPDTSTRKLAEAADTAIHDAYRALGTALLRVEDLKLGILREPDVNPFRPEHDEVFEMYLDLSKRFQATREEIRNRCGPAQPLLPGPAPRTDEPHEKSKIGKNVKEKVLGKDKKNEETPAPESTVEAVKETKTPAVEPVDPLPEASAENPKKEEEKAARSSIKTGRRLSARIGTFFMSKSKDVTHPATVDEALPKTEEPTPVTPLENPTADSTPATAEGTGKGETNKPSKIVEPTPAPIAPRPVIAAS